MEKDKARVILPLIGYFSLDNVLHLSAYFLIYGARDQNDSFSPIHFSYFRIL